MELTDFPPDLAAQATILACEPAWPPQTARRVVEYLRQSDQAVVGIELWVPEGRYPRVLGWSEYNVSFTGDWKQYVKENADQALLKISVAESSDDLPREILINLAWIDRKEIAVGTAGQV
jgi:hypothetical protein